MNRILHQNKILNKQSSTPPHEKFIDTRNKIILFKYKKTASSLFYSIEEIRKEVLGPRGELESQEPILWKYNRFQSREIWMVWMTYVNVWIILDDSSRVHGLPEVLKWLLNGQCRTLYDWKGLVHRLYQCSYAPLMQIR